jgi:hypothetical protein
MYCTVLYLKISSSEQATVRGYRSVYIIVESHIAQKIKGAIKVWEFDLVLTGNLC